jgi:hypothetical protein
VIRQSIIKKTFLSLGLFTLLAFQAFGQQIFEITGVVRDSLGNPIVGVNILLQKTAKGGVTGENGSFRLMIGENDRAGKLVFRHVNYIEKVVPIQDFFTEDHPHVIIMQDSIRILNQVDVVEDRIEEIATNVSTFELSPISAQFTPAPFQDISGILVTLPGVSSNNEFSTGYSVRGGNFDENLVYVNNIPIYRPQIITSGQQEGLSFVNTDLVQGIEFSSGGWETKYGDGLASTLNIRYKQPEQFGGSFNIGLLGGSLHFEGISKNQRFTYLVGARHKTSEYLLNTLETEGEYRPRFSDIQTYLNYDVSRNKASGKTEIGLLFSFAQNRYLVQPTSRETTFGTFNDQKRLFVAFDGQEKLTYDTWQSGIRLSHRLTSAWKTHLILSGTYSREREYYDIESGYLLCNVDNNPASPGFNECLTNIGIGTNYYSGRNLLDAKLFNAETRNEVIIDDKNMLEFGFGYAHHSFNDRLNEYEFIDSVDYVTITDAVKANSEIQYARISGYIQNTTDFNPYHALTYGVRMLFQSFGKDLLISPRIQYSWKPVFMRETYFRASAGIYQQAPLYREFRNSQGEINDALKAQSSFHGIVGMDVNFSKWGRPFKFTTEIFYKNLWNVNPYDIENVRIRYYADNIAKAYAAGIDFRLSGDFIPGDESWFSLGFLSTKEDLETDNRGYIPRPTDQRVNLAIFFQDHIPKMPSFRVHLRLLYSSGLPFSPPLNPENRNAFRGSEYQRIDIGFSKMIKFGSDEAETFLKSLWLSAEILNLTGHQNTISYYWVEDVNNIYYAVPNSLSQRFFNVRATLRF